jgi:hypothetical protein
MQVATAPAKKPELKKPEAPITLRTLAAKALRSRDGKVEPAIKALEAMLRRDRKLLRTIVAEAIHEAVGSIVADKHRERRRTVIRLATREDVEALAAGFGIAFGEFPLAGGVKLKEATREQIERQAEFYQHTAIDTGHKARWLRLIAQSLRPGEVAGEKITEQRFSELWKETEINGN